MNARNRVNGWVSTFVGVILVLGLVPQGYAQRPAHLKPPELVLFPVSGDKVVYKIEKADDAVKKLFESAEQGHPLLVYVHGRALGKIKRGYDKEPEESEHDYIPGLQAAHKTPILMFHWPHWGKLE